MHLKETIARNLSKITSAFGERNDFGFKADAPTYTMLHRLIEHYSLANLLPYCSYDEESQLFYNHNSVGFVIELCPITGPNEALSEQLTAFFRDSFPEKSNLQCLLWSSPKVGNLLDRWLSMAESSSEILKRTRLKRYKYFTDRSNQKEFAICDFRVILSFSFPKEDFTESLKTEILALREQIHSIFSTFLFNGSSFNWKAEDLMSTLSDIININDDVRPAKLEWHKLDSIGDQIPSSETQVLIFKDGLRINNQILKSYYVKAFPSSWSVYDNDKLLSFGISGGASVITSPFFIQFGIYIPPQSFIEPKLMLKASNVEKQAFSPLSKIMPSLHKQAQEWGEVRRNFEQCHRFIKSYYQVVVQDSPEKITYSSNKIKNLFRNNGLELQEEKYLQINGLLNIMPMTWGEGLSKDMEYMKRLRTSMTSEISRFLPLSGAWKGTRTPGMLFTSRTSQLFGWSPFDNQTGNYNVIVVGRSGSGKSVFMQELSASCIAMGGRVFVLDMGRSFEKTCKFFQGQYIDFSPQTALCINPFTNIRDDVENIDDQLSLLKPIIASMISHSGKVEDREFSMISQALKAVWEKHRNESTITDVAEWLKNHHTDYARDLGERMFPYTKNGEYGRFFNSAANINFTKNLVVIEMENLKERKELQAVVMQVMMLEINNNMLRGNRSIPWHIIIDEGWDLLRAKLMGEFIEMLARVVRKLFGSLVVGTQTVNDFYQSAGAKAAFDNSDWMCLLSQKAESIDLLKQEKRLSINPYMEKELKSLHTVQGSYAEVCIRGNEGYAIGRLMLDNFSKILYSTKAEEFSAVMTLVEQDVKLEEAVEVVAERVYGRS